jgi:putative FmdB family regulatory protein
MPISHYQCRKCGKRFEVFQRITDNPLKKCNFCGGRVNHLSSSLPQSIQTIPTPLYGPVSTQVIEKKKEKKEEKRHAKMGRRS